MNKLLPTFLLLLFFIIACNKGNDHGKMTPLIKVKSFDQISAEEFILRIIYSKRPSYCSGNHRIHKKIILNSLLAEKLFAMNEGNDNLLSGSERFQLYLTAHQEKAMRYYLFQETQKDSLSADSIVVNKTFDQYSYQYTARVLAAPLYLDPDTLPVVFAQLVDDSIFDSTLVDTFYQKKFTWNHYDEDPITKKIYEKEQNINDIVGPIYTDSCLYYIEIAEKVFQPPANNMESMIKAKISLDLLYQDYLEYINKQTINAEVKLNTDTFNAFADILYNHTVRDSQKRGTFASVWRNQSVIHLYDCYEQLHALFPKPLLVFGNEEWTVETLLKKASTNPIIIESVSGTDELWYDLLRKAVTEIAVKDAYTQKAYDKNLHRTPLIMQYKLMFRDAYLAELHREYFLLRLEYENKMEQDYFMIIHSYLNPYVENMFKSYSPRIKLNTKVYRQIDLAGIDIDTFIGLKYLPTDVPLFPLITTYKWLDYVKVYSD